LSLSILRQETTIEASKPLLISGRFTAFGFGLPGFIRVFVEGPSYDPEIRNFDTFSAPFSGDWSVNVLAEKEGKYLVYAKAFPPPLLPVGPPFPEPIALGPSLVESPRPPIAVGRPIPGGVGALLPTGEAVIPAPPLSPVEFTPIITVAPEIFVTIPGAPQVAAPPYVPYPAAPGVPAPPALPVPPAPKEAGIDDIRFFPDVLTPGQIATGAMDWRNPGIELTRYDLSIYFLDPGGIRYGPLQVEQDVQVSAGGRMTTALHLDTEGLPGQIYGVEAEITDPATGDSISHRIFPQRLELLGVAPEPPEPPAPLEPAALPTVTGVGIVF